jgi:predicted regulator of Ras-like GTPase activity (Roadblock/LC7/MglB family)
MSAEFPPAPSGTSTRLDQVLGALLSAAPEIEAAAVVSFDGLPMASALPRDMDEDRVAAMSAALLSLGDRAAQGLGRGDLSQVYVEGENGTVFLISADEEAVLVAVANARAKVGMMLFEVRRAAKAVAAALLADDVDAGYALPAEAAVPEPPVAMPVAATAEQVTRSDYVPQNDYAPAPQEYVQHPDAAPAAPMSEGVGAHAVSGGSIADALEAEFAERAQDGQPPATDHMSAYAHAIAQEYATDGSSAADAEQSASGGGPVMVPTGSEDGDAGWPSYPPRGPGWT